MNVNRMKKIIILLLIAVCVCSLSSCRKRVSNVASNEAELEQLKENAKQYLEDIEQILNGHMPEHTNNRDKTSGLDNSTGNKDNSQKKDDTAGRDEGGASEGSEEAGTGDGGFAPGSAETVKKYKTQLSRTVGNLQPCQRFNAYIEDTRENYAEGAGTSSHNIASYSGANNVADQTGRSGMIDKAWVESNNPDMIIKYVSGSVLGKGVTDTSAAAGIAAGIASRDVWAGSAARGNIILVSNQLLGTEQGRLVTEYYLGKAMYPDLFAGIDVDAIRDELLGPGYEGIYVYKR